MRQFADVNNMEIVKPKNLRIIRFFCLFVFKFLSFSLLTFLSSLVLAQDVVKPADLAGDWYPSSQEELSRMLEGFLSAVPGQKIDGDIIALIQPHAGYMFSGSVAAYGYSLLKDSGINTVIVVGFSHRRYFDGVSVFNKGAFDTPLGPLSINTELAEELIKQNPGIKFYPEAFIDENSVEMQLPFLKKVLGNVLIVPVAIGDQTYQTSEMLSTALYNVLKDRDGFLLIASSDMSHYLDYHRAVETDQRTLGILKEMSKASLFRESLLSGANILCGLSAVSSVLSAAQRLGADNIKVLKYANSGDTAGDKSKVVGYLSAVIHKNKISRSQRQKERIEDMLTRQQEKRLLQIARGTIEEYLKTKQVKDFPESDPALLEEKGAFVTLHKHGQLRGCIGNIIGKGPLYKTVRDMSIESATGDPRFDPVRLDELESIEIEISVLSKPRREFNPDNIIMGKHGVIVKKGFHSGVFLPQVAFETGWRREEFLSNLCEHKAGLPADAWKDKSTELYTFTAEVFAENAD